MGHNANADVCPFLQQTGREPGKRCGVIAPMDGDEIVELKCKFCGGRLVPDEPQRPARDHLGFKFFRCEKCQMPNVLTSSDIAKQQQR
jgi:hypothetical protein